MNPAQEADLLEKVVETHTMVHEKVVPWLENLNHSVSEVKERQHVFAGALGMLRWVVITGIAIGGMVGGYIYTQTNELAPIQIEIIQSEEGR